MKEKIIGYILLFSGLVILIYSLLAVYQMLTKAKNPVDIFNLPGVTIDLSKMVGADLSTSQNADSLKTEFVSPDVFNKPINLVANLMIFSFFANIGFKLAMLGVYLIRPIKVKLKEEGFGKESGVAGKKW